MVGKRPPAANRPGFVWPCGACGEKNVNVFLLEPGGAADDADPLADMHRLTILGGPVSMTIGVSAESAAEVSTALTSGDARRLFALNEEYAPFWCPACGDCYCANHYERWDIYDDDLPEFFDCARGRCPRGHERQLID